MQSQYRMPKYDSRHLWNEKPFPMLRLILHSLPSPLLALLRYCYSPSYRLALAERRYHAHIEGLLPQVLAATRDCVHAGLFKGMRYLNRAVCSALPPKLLGTYEQELSSVFEEAMAWCNCVIDIGAAEGYYAIGLATRLPLETRVIAYEATEEGRILCKELASINGVTKVELRGLCEVSDLARDTLEAGLKTLVLCDAEGAEYELLDPERVPGLLMCAILVELHPWVYPTVKTVIIERFAASHDVELIAARDRVVGDFPREVMMNLSSSSKLALMDECRPSGMEWLWIRPREVRQSEHV